MKAGEEPDPGCVQTEEGGLKYEVVLEEAKTKRMPRPKSAPSSSPRNYQDIQQKLQVITVSNGQYFTVMNYGARLENFEGVWMTNSQPRQPGQELGSSAAPGHYS